MLPRHASQQVKVDVTKERGTVTDLKHVHRAGLLPRSPSPVGSAPRSGSGRVLELVAGGAGSCVPGDLEKWPGSCSRPGSGPGPTGQYLRTEKEKKKQTSRQRQAK